MSCGVRCDMANMMVDIYQTITLCKIIHLLFQVRFPEHPYQKLQLISARCSAVMCSTMHCSLVQCIAMMSSTMQCSV